MRYRQLRLDPVDAWVNLKRRPLRTALSSLGIGIGVAALVAMLSISEGAKSKALAKIASLGTNTLRIENSLDRVHAASQSSANLTHGLTSEDAEKIGSWLGNRASVATYIRQDNVSVSNSFDSTVATVIAVSPAWMQTERLSLFWGRPLHAVDEEEHKQYCVVGNSIYSTLRVEGYSTLLMDGFSAKVVGVLQSKGRLLTEGTGLSALDFDESVIIPISNAPNTNMQAGRKVLDGIVIALRSPAKDNIFEVAAQLERLLLDNHNKVKDFRIVVPLKLLEEAQESQKLFSLIMGSIAGLSLLVGGIGVMNVMLANISEQTREIGLRMAVGATKARVMSLYLWNSIILTAGGAFWGSFGGIVVAFSIQKIAGWEIVFSDISLLIAPISAIFTGVIFGIHPALRAASLNPAIALRDN